MKFNTMYPASTAKGMAVAVKPANPFAKKHRLNIEKEQEKKIMRVISLNGKIDLPYDFFAFITDENPDGTGYRILAKEGANEYLMAEFTDYMDVERTLCEMRVAFGRNNSKYIIRTSNTQDTSED